MRQWVFDCWNCVMNMDHNPLKSIPDVQARHLIMQILAWMWCICFGYIAGSMWIGIASFMIHIVLLAAIAITVATFETAKRKPEIFKPLSGLRGLGGEHE